MDTNYSGRSENASKPVDAVTVVCLVITAVFGGILILLNVLCVLAIKLRKSNVTTVGAIDFCLSAIYFAIAVFPASALLPPFSISTSPTSDTKCFVILAIQTFGLLWYYMASLCMKFLVGKTVVFPLQSLGLQSNRAVTCALVVLVAGLLLHSAVPTAIFIMRVDQNSNNNSHAGQTLSGIHTAGNTTACDWRSYPRQYLPSVYLLLLVMFVIGQIATIKVTYFTCTASSVSTSSDKSRGQNNGLERHQRKGHVTTSGQIIKLRKFASIAVMYVLWSLIPLPVFVAFHYPNLLTASWNNALLLILPTAHDIVCKLFRFPLSTVTKKIRYKMSKCYKEK